MIPWFEGGHCDPWNHVESAMALDVAGLHVEAERAYEWMAATQRPDGSWHNYYLSDGIGRGAQARHQRVRLHRHRCVAPLPLHGDRNFVDNLWPTVERALDWVLAHRRHDGIILWAVEPDERPWDYALLTGTCRSSTRCGAVPRSASPPASIAPTGSRPPTS